MDGMGKERPPFHGPENVASFFSEATFAQDGGELPNSFLVLHATVPALKLVCIEVV